MNHISKRKQRSQPETREFWGVMSFYERFEQVVALILGGVIAIIIVAALWQLVREVFMLLILGGIDPLDFTTFQVIFGMIMTLLIAMEFKHSIIKVVMRRAHIIRVETVMLIAQIALARKFIILDLKDTDAMSIFALGFAVLALALAYWLLRAHEGAERWHSDEAISVISQTHQGR